MMEILTRRNCRKYIGKILHRCSLRDHYDMGGGLTHTNQPRLIFCWWDCPDLELNLDFLVRYDFIFAETIGMDTFRYGKSALEFAIRSFNDISNAA